MDLEGLQVCITQNIGDGEWKVLETCLTVVGTDSPAEQQDKGLVLTGHGVMLRG